MCSLLLATGGSSLSLGNTSDLLDSALDFLSLLAADLALNEVAVLYNNKKVELSPRVGILGIEVVAGAGLASP